VSLTIAVESPLQEDVRALVDAAHAYSGSLYPAESNHFLGIEALARGDVVFLVARIEGRAIGTGALKRHDARLGEIKQIWTASDCRGAGVGKRLLAHLEAEGRKVGLTRLALETGTRNTEALSLYRRSGFTDCPPFASYGLDPLSVFLAKDL